MAGSKRERDLARQKAARQQRDAAQAADKRRRRIQIGSIIVGVVAIVAVVAGIAVANSGSSNNANGSASESSTAPTTPAAAATSAAPSTSASANTAAVVCTKPNTKKPLTKKYSDFTKSLIHGANSYSETMTTNCGTIKFSLDFTQAPLATEALTFLSDRQYDDNTVCHRLVTTGPYILQCGDPTGTGRGTPGFSFDDQNLPTATNGQYVYPRGTVAMANSGPNTNGSQFFIVYKDSPLPAAYTVVGSVTEGMDIIDHVAAKGTVAGTTTPKQTVEILKMISSATIPQTAPTAPAQ